MNENAFKIICAWSEELDSSNIDLDNLTEQEYEEIVFSNWALEEILQFVWDHPWTPASETVLDFALRMIVCAKKASTNEQKRIFRVAEGVAWELLEAIKEVEE